MKNNEAMPPRVKPAAQKVANWTISAPGYFVNPVTMRSKTAVVGMVRDLLEQGVALTVTPNFAPARPAEG